MAVAMVLPPGLEPPPGLPTPPGLERPKSMTVAPPPGLEKIDHGAEDVAPPLLGEVTVQISNLNQHVLSEIVLESILHQANLDRFVSSMTLHHGAHGGEAFVVLTNRDAALRCARHFHGQCQAGLMVTARLMPPVPKTASKTLSAEAPTFVPTSALSADAPEFIPMSGMLHQYLTAAATKTRKSELKRVESDVSTNDGGSAAASDNE